MVLYNTDVLEVHHAYVSNNYRIVVLTLVGDRQYDTENVDVQEEDHQRDTDIIDVLEEDHPVDHSILGVDQDHDQSCWNF